MRPKVGIGILVLQGNSILMGQRKNAHGNGKWGLPGGHLEFKETVNECTLRELEEETGLQALEIKQGPWVETFFSEKHYITIFTFVSSFKGELKNCEPEKTQKWEWFPINSLPAPIFEPLAAICIEKSLESFLEKNFSLVV